MKPNKRLIPLTIFSASDIKEREEFNEIYRYCQNLEDQGILKQFVITPSTGISVKRCNIYGARWSLQTSKTKVLIILRHPETGRYYKFQIGYIKDNDKVSGRGNKAFTTYFNELKADNVDLNTLALTGTKDENKQVKDSIPKAKIELKVVPKVSYHNAHHIDLNSAFNAGMAEAFPILRPTIERMYAKRKENPIYKDILNMTQGYFQSEMVQYKYSHISKAGYEWTNKRLEELTTKLVSSGRRILSYNTDGIWYQGDLYHDENEGTKLGQWKTDYKNCKIRYRSKGAYEFIENGIYKPVFRGESSYEFEKPREEWSWGDIFMGEVITYKFVKGYGVYRDDAT